MADPTCVRWASLWLFDAVWHVLHFMMLLAIAVLWAPSSSHARSAYLDAVDEAEAAAEEDTDADDAEHEARAQGQ